MNFKGITLIALTVSTVRSFLLLVSAIPWPFFCGKLMTCTKLPQSTQILICQILKFPNTFFSSNQVNI